MNKAIAHVNPQNSLSLLSLGAQITARRKVLKVRAQSCAGAAGISRVTLHRIEKGEPSVNIGAYLQVCEALGLNLALLSSGPQELSQEKKLKKEGSSNNDMPHIRIQDYPQLKALAWQLKADMLLTDDEAVGIYERNKRFLDLNQINDQERVLMQRLIATKGMEHLLV